jgi:hypothetical protein
VGGYRIQRWDGIQWSDQNWDRPNYLPNLSSVSCASATNCIAVGSRWYHTTKTLVEKWNGQSWTQVASANSPESPYYGNNLLSAVSCKAAVRCFAAGTVYMPRSTKTLVERAP